MKYLVENGSVVNEDSQKGNLSGKFFILKNLLLGSSLNQGLTAFLNNELNFKTFNFFKQDSTDDVFDTQFSKQI